jgi:hypothetical protein
MTVNPFRPDYLDLSDDEKEWLSQMKDQAFALHQFYEGMPASRYASLAKTALEESVMWATKGLRS